MFMLYSVDNSNYDLFSLKHYVNYGIIKDELS